MPPSTRRKLLQTSGVTLGGLLAGCLSDVTSDGAPPQTSRTPTGVPAATETATQSPTPTETDEWPPPSPTPGAPEDPTPMPVSTDWQRLGADAGNTNHDDGVTALPESSEVYWHFFAYASVPVVADGTLYTTESGDGRYLVARDAATGSRQWATEASDGGALGVPVVADDRILVQSYSSLFCFDRATGTEQWRFDVGRGPVASPVVRDGVVYLANGEFSGWPAEAFAVGLADGEHRWRTDLGIVGGRLRGSVAVDDSAVYVVAGDLRALDQSDGTVRWTHDLSAPAETTPTLADGSVYVTDTEGTLHAVSTDGTERWTASVGEPIRGSAVAVAGEEVYAGTETGLTALSTDGTRRWRGEARRATTPTVGSDAVYVGERGFDNRSVLAFGRDEGERRWEQRTEKQTVSDYTQAGVWGPPTLVDGGVYVAAADGLYAFGR
jgi:outer membrane protein assembly factor BamB